ITGLSLPTVNKIVYYLEDLGRIKEAGTTTGLGRKAVLYVTNGQHGNILTLSLAGNSFTCCAVNMIGEIIHRFTSEINISSYESSLADTYTAIDRLTENCNSKIVSIGIGISGIVNAEGIISNLISPISWNGLNLQEVISQKYDVPVYIENNVHLATIGYFDWILKKSCNNMIYIHVGKEVSAGAILGRKLYKGFSSFAGECGFMVTEDLEKIPQQSVKDGGHLENKIAHIVEGLNTTAEKEKLLQLKKELAIHITSILINYIAVMNPEVIVLGGTVVGKEYAKLIAELVGRYIPKDAMPAIMVDSNTMSGTQGMISWCKARQNMGYNIILDA
ncbi:MAG: ROK family protein, partial [Oscillospiraceae bacterium]